jgi:type VI secretion system protein
MAVRGLLGRLATGQRRAEPLPAIVAHLSDLLNSHQGHSCTVPAFGVLDFNDVVHNLPDAVRHLQQSIRATIIAHEPRLQNVNVRFVPGDDPLVLQFEIVARLASDRHSLVRMKTRVRPGGQIVVE